MKRMLINATQAEELRVALVDGQRLFDLDIENRTRIQKKASIYKGIITRIEPSLEAAFVNFGADKHGFLPLKEISKQFFSKSPSEIQGRFRIQDVVKEGTEIIVQVDKEERGNKGAALTTFISLAGRYMVLLPNNPKGGGISRRIEGEDREQLRSNLKQINIPQGMSVIVRTAGVGKTQEELQWDLDYLLSLWNAITTEAEAKKGPFLIYQESNVIIRTIRDYLKSDIEEVLIDSKSAFDEAVNFIKLVIPHYEKRIKFYNHKIPLFSRYQIESQIETAFEREVRLPSGGSIVIDPTEALVSIDINSAKATKGGDIEETAFRTNLEAAEEIARQLRLRDIGGLIVIDFIDMMQTKSQREVESTLKEALKVDRARIQTSKISKFGLLEMSRQRLRPSLEETSSITCPRCNGNGTIRASKSLALSIIRLIKEELNKTSVSEVQAIVPMDIGLFILNEKQQDIASAQQFFGKRIVIIPSPQLDSPHYEIKTIKPTDGYKPSTSYDIEVSQDSSNDYLLFDDEAIKQQPVAAVNNIQPNAPAPARAKKPAPKKAGLLSKIAATLFPDLTSKEEPEAAPNPPSRKKPVKTERSPSRERPKRDNKNAQRRKANPNTRQRQDNTSTERVAGANQRRKQERETNAKNQRKKKNALIDSSSATSKNKESSQPKTDTLNNQAIVEKKSEVSGNKPTTSLQQNTKPQEVLVNAPPSAQPEANLGKEDAVAPAKIIKNDTRAQNDPRDNPRQIDMVIVNMDLPKLDLPPRVIPTRTRPSEPRASNDPRNKTVVTTTVDILESTDDAIK